MIRMKAIKGYKKGGKKERRQCEQESKTDKEKKRTLFGKNIAKSTRKTI